jgi:hypothetical protein
MLLLFPSPFPTLPFHFLAFKCIRLLCQFHLRLSLFRFLFVAFSSDCCSFTFSLLLSPPTVAFFHVIVCSLFLLFLSVAFTSDCSSFRLFRHRTRFLFVAIISDCCSLTFSSTLSSPTVVHSLYRFQMHSSLCHFHLRLSLFRFLFVAFTSDCCSFTFCLLLSPPTVAFFNVIASKCTRRFAAFTSDHCSFTFCLSLPTVQRHRSRSSSECIRLLGSLSFSLF